MTDETSAAYVPAGFETMKHRQQFDSRDAEFLKIGNFLDQAGIRAARSFRKTGAGMAREPSHMPLVNDGREEFFLISSGGGGGGQAVPEPVSFLLAGSGLIGIYFLQRRQAKSR